MEVLSLLLHGHGGAPIARCHACMLVAGAVMAGAIAWLCTIAASPLRRPPCVRRCGRSSTLFIVQGVIYAFHEFSEARLLPWSDVLHAASEPYGPDGAYGIHFSDLLVRRADRGGGVDRDPVARARPVRERRAADDAPACRRGNHGVVLPVHGHAAERRAPAAGGSGVARGRSRGDGRAPAHPLPRHDVGRQFRQAERWRRSTRRRGERRSDGGDLPASVVRRRPRPVPASAARRVQHLHRGAARSDAEGGPIDQARRAFPAAPAPRRTAASAR